MRRQVHHLEDLQKETPITLIIGQVQDQVYMKKGTLILGQVQDLEKGTPIRRQGWILIFLDPGEVSNSDRDSRKI